MQSKTLKMMENAKARCFSPCLHVPPFLFKNHKILVKRVVAICLDVRLSDLIFNFGKHQFFKRHSEKRSWNLPELQTARILLDGPSLNRNHFV